MPELPDLQVFSRNLTKQLKGKKLHTVSVPHAQKLNVSVADLKKALEGSKLDEVVREGKELHFKFGKHTLGLHLMLRGQLFLFDKKNDHKNPIIELLFDDDHGLVLTDFQGAATPKLDPPPTDVPDALNVTEKYLEDLITATRTNIKTFLLDQHKVRGIGNAYADEILWDAGISPLSVCNKIPVLKIKALTKSIKSVLKDAEKEIVKSHPDIISGEVRDFLKIHNAHKTKSPTGGNIEQTEINSRKTYYTHEQELFK